MVTQYTNTNCANLLFSLSIQSHLSLGHGKDKCYSHQLVFLFFFRKAMLERKRFLCGFRLLRIRHVV